MHARGLEETGEGKREREPSVTISSVHAYCYQINQPYIMYLLPCKGTWLSTNKCADARSHHLSRFGLSLTFLFRYR